MVNKNEQNGTEQQQQRKEKWEKIPRKEWKSKEMEI